MAARYLETLGTIFSFIEVLGITLVKMVNMGALSYSHLNFKNNFDTLLNVSHVFSREHFYLVVESDQFSPVLNICFKTDIPPYFLKSEPSSQSSLTEKKK